MLLLLLSLCWSGKKNDPPCDEVPGEEGEHHETSHQDQPHTSSLGERLWEVEAQTDGGRHLLTWLGEPVLGPEEGKHQSLGELTEITTL